MGSEWPEVRGQHQESLGLVGTMRRILPFSALSGAREAASQTAGFGPELTPRGSGGVSTRHCTSSEQVVSSVSTIKQKFFAAVL